MWKQLACTAVKVKDVLTQATTTADLEGLVPREMSQWQKDKCYGIPCTGRHVAASESEGKHAGGRGPGAGRSAFNGEGDSVWGDEKFWRRMVVSII